MTATGSTSREPARDTGASLACKSERTRSAGDSVCAALPKAAQKSCWQSPSILEVNYPALESDRNGFGAVAHAEFCHHVLEMHLDRLLGAADDARDVAIAEAARREAKHFDLA